MVYEMQNFLITGMGRSGTCFLANLMNQSPTWTVKHEPRGSRDTRSDAFDVQGRFNQDRYGEVNSYLRYVAKDMHVAKLGILIRDPIEVWRSICIRKAVHEWDNHLDDYERAIDAMEHLRDSGAIVIDFHRMVKDPDYTSHMIEAFGIPDVKVTRGGVEKVENPSAVSAEPNMQDSHLERIKGFRSRVMPWLLSAPLFE